MTNKHKQQRGGRPSVAKAEPADRATDSGDRTDRALPSSPSPLEQQAGGWSTMTNFTKAQLSMLVMLWLGLSKLFDLFKALSELRQDGSSSICASWLADPCSAKDDDGGGLQSLIQLKFHAGTQLAVLVVSAVLHAWQTERLLQRLVSLLVVCPVFLLTSIVIFLGKDTPFRQTRLKQITAVCFLLAAVATPATRDGYPFVGVDAARLVKSATLQGLALLVLVVSSLSSAVWGGALLSDSPDTAAALGVSWVCRLDYLSMSCVFAFVLVHCPNSQQRTFLFSVGMLKLYELFFQLPAIEKAWSSDADATRCMLVGTALLCLLSWIAPNVHLFGVETEGTPREGEKAKTKAM